MGGLYGRIQFGRARDVVGVRIRVRVCTSRNRGRGWIGRDVGSRLGDGWPGDSWWKMVVIQEVPAYSAARCCCSSWCSVQITSAVLGHPEPGDWQDQLWTVNCPQEMQTRSIKEQQKQTVKLRNESARLLWSATLLGSGLAARLHIKAPSPALAGANAKEAGAAVNNRVGSPLLH